MIKHNVSLDGQKLQSKPARDDMHTVPGIVDRLGRNETDAEVTIIELLDAIILPNGQSWSPATYTGVKDQNHWKSQGYFALDFDASDEIKPTKREMFGDDLNEKILWEEVITRCEATGVLPCVIHTSFSSDPSHNKFRVIFQLDETVTNPKIAKSIQYLLFLLFPESDIQCATDISRFFYGGKEVLWMEPDNKLDPYALFGSAATTIKKLPTYDIIKKYIQFNIGLKGVELIDIKKYMDLDDSERCNIYQTSSGANVRIIHFLFEHIDLNKKATADLYRQPSEVVMDDYEKGRLEKALEYIDMN